MVGEGLAEGLAACAAICCLSAASLCLSLTSVTRILCKRDCDADDESVKQKMSTRNGSKTQASTMMLISDPVSCSDMGKRMN